MILLATTTLHDPLLQVRVRLLALALMLLLVVLLQQLLLALDERQARLRDARRGCGALQQRCERRRGHAVVR